MQNLQTKYDFHSAQTAYLSQFQLIEQDETTQERPEREVGFNCDSFEFSEVDVSENDEHVINFSQYLEDTFILGKMLSNKRLRVLMLQICLGLWGELAQEDYLQLMNRNQNLNIKYNKFIVIGHLFFLFVALCFLPTFIIALLCILLVKFTGMSQTSLFSEFQKLVALPKQLNAASSRLKLLYLNHYSSITQQQAQCISYTIEQLLTNLEQRFDTMPSKDTIYMMDKLDEIIYGIVVKIKQIDLEKQFMDGGYFNKKLNYWRAKVINFRLNKAIWLIDQTILTIESISCWAGEPKQKQRTNQVLYYSIFASKVSRLQALSSPSQDQKAEMKRLISILIKQLHFRQVRTLRENPDSNRSIISEESQLPATNLSSLLQKTETRGLCFEDDRVEEYKPEDVKDIRVRLETIMKDRLRKKQDDKIDQHNEEGNKQIKFSEIKKERVVFGIPIPPPQKDMSAYYIQ